MKFKPKYRSCNKPKKGLKVKSCRLLGLFPVCHLIPKAVDDITSCRPQDLKRACRSRDFPTHCFTPEVRMANESFGLHLELTLDPFVIPLRGKYPIFFLGLAIYCFGVFCNLTLLTLIVVKRSLHKPVYFILFSLPLNDLIGITAMLPKVLSDIVTETNKTSYPLCVLQAFMLHMYGGGILFILAAMSFDRYVAICLPLRYSSVMTHRAVICIVSLVWGLDFILNISLFSLQIRLPRCKSVIRNVFCDNPSLVKLTCGNTGLNNIVGLFNTALMQVVSVSVQAFSYVKILIACVTRRSVAKTKAVNTCVAQLVILIIFEVVGMFTILSHRFKNVSPDLQKIMGMLIFIVPPLLNPLVYGLYTSEIRNNLLSLKNRVFV
ncbi:olfactory receptor 4E1-like [Synchiropus splendidus]|uniref:olfactory receptor 4E1-like n=1 Tax=Synchiropus splendidus TaxID=270530 RepID=UPI00237D8BE5|nr:olfactory receptor 4E1-like [Synchiropus splendidus]